MDQTLFISMKQKLKDLLKKKNKPTFDEAAAYFTAMTDAQKAAKKGGVTDEAFPVGLESTNFGGNTGVMNAGGFEPKLTRTKRWGDFNGGWLPEVVIHGKTKKPNSPQSPTHPNFPAHPNPNIPYWPNNTFPTVVTPHPSPEDTRYSVTPKEWAEWNARNEKETSQYIIAPHKVETGAMRNTTIGANKTDFFEDEEARKRSERYKNITLGKNLTYGDQLNAFKTISERSDYYRWVNKQLEGKSKWFGAAAIVTGPWAVGAAEGLNLHFLNDAAEKLLKEGNKKLFEANILTAHSMIYENQVRFREFTEPGKDFYVDAKGKNGKRLDYYLVQFEQTQLHYFLHGYKKNNSISEYNSAIKSINSSMGSRWAPSQIREVMNEQFNVKKGQQAFDFDKYEHRVKLGQGIIDKLYEYDKK